MKKKEITKEEIEKALKELFYSKAENNDRKIKIVTFRSGYKLFCEAMEKAAKEYLNKSDGV